MKIDKVTGRMIFDSRGNPTVEATVFCENFKVKAAAPSGASTGKHEAVELRDGEDEYKGKGVKKAVNNIKKINEVITGLDCTKQEEVDDAMKWADGTENKANLGANAIVAVSMAVARAGAKSKEMELFEYLNPEANRIPYPMMNIINGGMHAGSGLAIQEFMIVPVGAENFVEAMKMGTEVYHTLKKILVDNFGPIAKGIGDEGGFAPPIKKTYHVLDTINLAIEDAGYKGKIKIALDCAASSFYNEGKYEIDDKKLTPDELIGFYVEMCSKYDIFSIEDPFDEEDFESFAKLHSKVGCKIIADDLTVTNTKIIKKALEMKCMDTLLLKVNQIGTLSEAMAAAKMMFDVQGGVVVSHRSGETCDTFIADLSVALNCGMIKTGAPCRSERVSKYNRLLEIEQILGEKAVYGL
jgi:enolase